MRLLKIQGVHAGAAAVLALACGCSAATPKISSPRRITREARGSLFLPVPQRVRESLPALSVRHTAELNRELTKLTGKDRSLVQRALDREHEEARILASIFRDEGIPEELLGLALIESAFRSDARSPAGAVGIWQMMRDTAKRYGLRVDFFEDQRKDPVLSTIAAARMLRDLFHVYRDWHLVIAAYNAGSGKVSRDIASAGTSDFWELSRKGFLSKETRAFVPRVLAAAIILKSPSAYGFHA